MQNCLYALPKRIQQSELKTIKFVGNMKNNIHEIMSDIECQCGLKSEFCAILNIFGEKIEKLRAERDNYKRKYYEDVQALKNQMENLQQAMRKIQQSADFCFPMMTLNNNSQQFYQKFPLQERGISQQINTKNTKENQLKQKEQNNSQKELLNNLQALIRKYNIKEAELETLIKQYIEEYENQFDSQEQKKLYRLSKKLEKGIWMKKVKRDIETLVNAKKYAQNNQNMNQSKKQNTLRKAR